jgi:hypothetical protein
VGRTAPHISADRRWDVRRALLLAAIATALAAPAAAQASDQLIVTAKIT